MKRVAVPVLFVVLTLLSWGIAGAIAAASADAVVNQQAPLSNLLLRVEGGKATAITSLTWTGSALMRSKVWPAESAALDARGALFTVADFTGDGLPDGAMLRPVGTRGALIHRFVSDGASLTRSQAWKSGAAGFKVTAAKIASGDIDDDGLAEMLVLAPYGRAGAQILSFDLDESGVVKRSVYRTRAAGFSAASAQLACGDLDADGRVDVVVLGRRQEGGPAGAAVGP